MAGENILVVDDEPRYLRLIRFNLESEGYHVIPAGCGEDALQLIGSTPVDMVLLDVLLPGISGLEVCERIREVSNVQVIMLTAMGSTEDRVNGLRKGADDYLPKPFSSPELLARVDAVLRRASNTQGNQPQAAALNLRDLKIDFLERKVIRSGQEVSLSPTEYRLLACLASSMGAVLVHDQLLDRVWGPDYRGENEMLRVTIWRLRKKLEEDPSNPRIILTRPGVGYMLDAAG